MLDSSGMLCYSNTRKVVYSQGRFEMTSKTSKTTVKKGGARIGRKQATGRGGAREGAGRKAMTGKKFMRASAQLTEAQIKFVTAQGEYTGADGKKRFAAAVGIRKAVEFYQTQIGKPARSATRAQKSPAKKPVIKGKSRAIKISIPLSKSRKPKSVKRIKAPSMKENHAMPSLNVLAPSPVAAGSLDV